MTILSFVAYIFFLPIRPILEEIPVANLVTWKCNNPTWPTQPSVANSIFKGKVKVSCSIQTDTVSTYDLFYNNFLRSAVAEAKPLHSGPTDETFEGMASKRLDLTTVINESGLNSVRSDVHLAWDKANLVLLSTESKAIQATGLAANLQKIDNRVEIRRIEDHNHQLVFFSESTIKKPGLVPTNLFKNKAMDEMEKQIKAQLGPNIKALVENM